MDHSTPSTKEELAAIFTRMWARDHIKVWRFADAPETISCLSQNGGDEDWVVVCPTAIVGMTPFWIEATDSGREPQRFDLPGGDFVVFIGSHG